MKILILDYIISYYIYEIYIKYISPFNAVDKVY